MSDNTYFLREALSLWFCLTGDSQVFAIVDSPDPLYLHLVPPAGNGWWPFFSRAEDKTVCFPTLHPKARGAPSIVVFPKVDGIKFCLKQFCLLKSA